MQNKSSLFIEYNGMQKIRIKIKTKRSLRNYVQEVVNWYLHYQMVKTQEQEIVHGIIHQKKAKSMPFSGI